MVSFARYLRKASQDLNFIFRHELRACLRDGGVLIFFVLVPLAYPLLYSFIYTNEVVRDVPVAVVDADRSSASRRYLRLVDASPDVRIAAYCADLSEAQSLVKRRQAYGIVYVPESFSRDLARGEQTYVSAFADMSGLLYYKAVLLANTEVSLKMNAEIKVERMPASTEEQDRITQYPLAYDEVSLFNPQNGFAAFLIPAVLILIIQQTLLLGVGMANGTAREHNLYRELVPVQRHYLGLLRIVFGKALAYLLIYLPVSVFVLGVVPHLFRLNQIGAPLTLALFVIPFLVASIFFAMAATACIRHRETGMLLVVYTSVLLLFISGVSWPGASIPPFWKGVSYLFPSTLGINGFVRINNMGADLSAVRTEWLGLWYQAATYFFITCWAYRWEILSARRRYVAQYRRLKQRQAERRARLEGAAPRA